MLQSILPGLLFLIPLIFCSYFVFKLVREKRRNELFYHFWYSLAALPFFYQVLSQFDYWYFQFLVMISFMLFYKAARAQPSTLPIRRSKYVMLVLIVGVTAYIAWQEFQSTPEEGFDLTSPIPAVPEGLLIVAKGGNTKIFNHHITVDRQRWAVDISIKLGLPETIGQFTGKPEKFRIFGQEIVSACDGTVVEARDDLPDQAPGVLYPKVKTGNVMQMECEAKSKSYIVRYAHLKQGSLTVKVGDRLAKGSVFAQVGNTGNTSSPHLHLDVIEKESGISIPLLFEGKFLRAGERL